MFNVAFVAFGYYILMWHMNGYLIETASVTPFLTTWDFFREMTGQPCGLLFYVASAAQSCFAIPALGVTLLLVVLSALAWILRVCMNMGRKMKRFICRSVKCA